jgi:hypothetical protein
MRTIDYMEDGQATGQTIIKEVGDIARRLPPVTPGRREGQNVPGFTSEQALDQAVAADFEAMQEWDAHEVFLVICQLVHQVRRLGDALADAAARIENLEKRQESMT